MRHARRRIRATAVARWLSLGVIAALAAGCAATPQTTALQRKPPPDLPPAAELTEVPFFPQERYQCGPAALATVLTYSGFETEPADLVDAVYVPEKQGSLKPEMRAAARARGAVAYPLDGRLETVMREIAAGHPVLVMQNLALDWWPRWHYAVAVGYDMGRDHVILRSGRSERRLTLMPTFERTWARADRWAQAVVAPDDPPVSAEPLDWLQAVRDLAETGAADAALTGYETATERWPESQPAWLALGNARFERGDYAAARRAFTQALERAPQSGDGWNNLAYALARTGCAESAVEAARCAVRLEPDEQEFQDTLDELTGGARTQGLAGDCGIPQCPSAGEAGN